MVRQQVSSSQSAQRRRVKSARDIVGQSVVMVSIYLQYRKTNRAKDERRGERTNGEMERYVSCVSLAKFSTDRQLCPLTAGCLVTL